MQIVFLVPSRQAEAADAAGYLPGVVAFPLAGDEQSISPAYIDPAAGQGRARKYRPEVNLLKHAASGGVKGDQLATAYGGEIQHAVAHSDP